MDTTSLIRRFREDLSPSERLVAEVVIAQPHVVAFGTVAEVARASGTSGATVVRLASRLGLSGFAELQDRVREDLTHDMRRATERIRNPEPHDVLDAATEAANRAADTLSAIRRADFETAVRLLSTRSRRVVVLVSDAATGIGRQFAEELHLLRPDVSMAAGTPVSVTRALSDLDKGDVLVVLDFPRYDRWLLEAAGRSVDDGAVAVALTESELSPLADLAEVAFVVPTAGAGPFDSHLGALAVLEALLAGVSHRLRSSAARRLEAVEAAWDAAAVFLPE